MRRMLKKTAAILVLVTIATGGHAQAPAEGEPAAPLTSRAVMTGEQVIRLLDETVDW
jgi:hypothetical protein